MTAPISHPRLYFITGKGGVGKTTVTAALAVMLAKRNKRVLAIEIGQVSSLGKFFGIEKLEYAPMDVADGISCCRLTPEMCLREYGVMKLKIRRLFDMVFNNPFVKSLVNMLPGMEELLLIGKLGYVIRGMEEGRSRYPYDVVVVDAPPTGQGAGLFSLPATILAAVKAGPLAKEVSALRDMLSNEATTGLLIVTVPEELAVDEALELEKELVETQQLPVVAQVVNKAVRNPAGRQDIEVLKTFVHARRARRVLDQGYSLVAGALSVLDIQKGQEAQKTRLRRRSGMPIIELPMLPAAHMGEEQLEKLAQRLGGLLESTGK